MKYPFSLVFFFLFFQYTLQHVGLHLQKSLTTSVYHCIRDSGTDFVVIDIRSGTKGLNGDDLQGMINAGNTGLDVDIRIYPCRGMNAKEQAKMFFNNIRKNNYNKLWVTPAIFPDEEECGWKSGESISNCLYLMEFAEQAKLHSRSFGIAVSEVAWAMYFMQQCKHFGDDPLYWIPHKKGDCEPNFDSYQKFGGWKKPNKKLLTCAKKVCGVDTQQNYFP